MKNIALIPARGGSKRLPGKNLMPLGGQSLIAWTINAAIKSDCFDLIIVSTDDEKIACEAQKLGALVPFIRPSSLASDTASTDDVVKHAVEWLETSEKASVETVTILQPTSPFRTGKHIQEAFHLFRTRAADGVVSVKKCASNIRYCNTLPVDDRMVDFIKGKVERTQDLEDYYELNGAIYIFKKNFSGNMMELFSNDSSCIAYKMNEISSIDIDTYLDYLWAEFLIIRNLVCNDE